MLSVNCDFVCAHIFSLLCLLRKQMEREIVARVRSQQPMLNGIALQSNMYKIKYKVSNVRTLFYVVD